MHKKQGFTLIELMIVIAVIGILAAMALPNFKQARERARQAKCFEYTALLTRTAELYFVEKAKYPDKIDDLYPYINGNKSGIACPSGGVFSVVSGTGDGGSGNLVYFCSMHGCATATWGGA